MFAVAGVVEVTTAPGIVMGVAIVVWQLVGFRVRRRRRSHSHLHLVDPLPYDSRRRRSTGDVAR